jgi:DNA-binding NtrC family response regulator
LAEQALVVAERLGSSVAQWHQLTNHVTRNRILIRQGRFTEVVEAAEKGLQAAEQVGSENLATTFKTQRAEALIGLGSPDAGASIAAPSGMTPHMPLSVVGARHLVAAKALLATGSNKRGQARLGTAMRILEHAGDKLTELEARLTADAQSAKGDSNTGVNHHLDSAVALLELSGHPHILGREAFAVLQDTGCAEALALGARTARGVLRVIAADGWTDADALAALRAAGQDDLMPLGQHRDEAWEILARPRPELDHRCTLAAIRKLIASACALDQYRRDEKQRAALWPAEALEGDAESLWVSEQSTELLHLARRIASSPMPVLLTGETGTGKEMLARVIHRASNRADRPLVPFNCTAVPHDMLESQLFGYRKGAFTSAVGSFQGVIRNANGGTLFLDEIGDISLDLQPKLLRFIEQQEVHPLGEAQAVKVDVRIIAATNANLDELVAQGRFREDLLYRLKILPLHLPPLRERREEIPALLQHYLQKFGDEQRKGRVTLSDETLEYLLLYTWPGNIRQLANEVRRIIALVEPDATVTPALLSQEIQASRRTLPAAGAPAEPEIRLRLDQPLPMAVDALEQTLVRHALERSNGRVEEAARILGISRKGLFLKRRRWGLQQAS